MSSADYSQLPLEIIVNILSYLRVRDVKSAIQSCRQWLYASQFSEIQNKIILKLTDKFLTEQSLFKNTLRKFPHIYLSEISLLNDFFSLPHIYKNIESITFDNCIDLTSLEKLASIIKNMKNLHTLNFCNIIIDEELKDEEEIVKFQKRITQLKSLTFLCDKKYKIRNLCPLVKLFRYTKNLEIFKIVDKSITQSLFVKKFKFYLYQIIKRNAKNLKVLHLPFFFTNDGLLKSLLLMNDLKLDNFNIQFLEIKWNNFDKFLLFQNHISVICLSNCTEITDNDIDLIVENLKLLKFIDLNCCELLTNKSLINISKLKELQCLKICENDNFTSIGILNGIAKEENFYIRKLFTLGISFNEKTYIKIAENLHNIEVLHIGSRSINDNAMQAIIKNCSKLYDLNLYGSSQITDYGLTGIDQFGSLPIQTGYSLQHLCKLESLNLRRCSKITDSTLINGFKLPNLKKLYLPSCFSFVTGLPWLKIRKISIPGFEAFVKYCPNIETLNLLGCSGYDNLDVGISIALKQLKYLNTVEIARRCDRQVRDQYAFLKKGRKDLSKIEITCQCSTCLAIRNYCQEFLEDKIVQNY